MVSFRVESRKIMKKSKNNEGFTLVEIIIVIAVLVVIGGLFAVNMINTLNKNKEEESESVVTRIKSAADAYVAANPEEVERLYNGYGYVDIPIGDLRDGGFLDEKLKDASTGNVIPDEDIVRVKLEIGDYFNFMYPLTLEEKNATSWAMVAEDLTIEYDKNANSEGWCSNKKNVFKGLYDEEYSDKNNYAEVTSKLYLMDNSKEGKMFTGNYFDEAKLESVACDVDPTIAGTYNITYKYADPSSKAEKTFIRKVYVKTSTNDTISFTATINDGKKIPLGARDVPIVIVETYKDGTTSELRSTDSSLGAIEYGIENFTTDTSGTREATIVSKKVNSDGSTAAPKKVNYTVTESLAEIITDSNSCTPTGSSTCYLRCEQSENYASYNGSIYRFYAMSGKEIKLIYEGEDIKSPYGQLGDCTNNSCCNGGRHLYNKLGTTSKVPKPTMDAVLDQFYTDKNVSGPKIKSQNVPSVGLKKIALMTKQDYTEVSKGCPSNYLTGVSAFWLVDSANSNAGAAAYNRGSLAAYAYDYAVDIEGKVYTDGASKKATFQGDYGTQNVQTSELTVRPTILLNNPDVHGGAGTKNNPYVLD